MIIWTQNTKDGKICGVTENSEEYFIDRMHRMGYSLETALNLMNKIKAESKDALNKTPHPKGTGE